MTWRALIYQYLWACCEDSKKGVSNWHNLSQTLFISRFADETLRTRFEQSYENLLQQHREVSPPEGYALVEESANLLVADVEPVEHGEPRLKTRFVLVRSGGDWLIRDLYWTCTCQCSVAHPTGGKCLSCDGTGKKEREKCASCGGTGRCEYCSKSDQPGWRLLFANKTKK